METLNDRIAKLNIFFLSFLNCFSSFSPYSLFIYIFSIQLHHLFLISMHFSYNHAVSFYFFSFCWLDNYAISSDVIHDPDIKLRFLRPILEGSINVELPVMVTELRHMSRRIRRQSDTRRTVLMARKCRFKFTGFQVSSQCVLIIPNKTWPFICAYLEFVRIESIIMLTKACIVLILLWKIKN